MLAVLAFPIISSTNKREWEENLVQDHSRSLASDKIDNNARLSKTLWIRKKCVGPEKWQRQIQRNCVRPLGEEILNLINK